MLLCTMYMYMYNVYVHVCRQKSGDEATTRLPRQLSWLSVCACLYVCVCVCVCVCV